MLPLIPERGSCGASGDLVPLSYVGRTLAGETEVLYEGEVREAADVLAELGLEPLALEAKEGLALTNGTSFMTRLRRARRSPTRASWPSWPTSAPRWPRQALLGNRGHFNAFLFEAKPHPGMIESAANIRALLDGSQPHRTTPRRSSPLG